MIERVIENPLGYVKRCLENGIPLSSWEVILKGGLVWLENQHVQLRIRGIIKSQSNQPEPNTGGQTVKTEEKTKWGQIPKYSSEEKRELIQLARRAGLLGNDRVH